MNRKVASLFFRYLLGSVFVIIIIYLISLGYEFDKTGFGDYRSPQVPDGVTFVREKTLWDWLGLLAIPILLTFGALLVSNSNQNKVKLRDEQRDALEKEKLEQRQKFERWMGYDRAREQALQEYFVSIEALILQNGLKKSKPDSEVREVARARTLDILRRLDGERKRLVLDFLYRTHLIKITDPCVALNFAGFNNFAQHLPLTSNFEHTQPDYFADVERTANLVGIYLRDVQFQEANFIGVQFTRAILRNVDFSDSTTNNANFSHTNMKDVKFVNSHLHNVIFNVSTLLNINFENSSLNSASFKEAWLENINFNNADLRHVNFQNANFQNADFQNAKINDADFDYANLKSCKISKEQWGTVRSHVGTIKPDKFL